MPLYWHFYSLGITSFKPHSTPMSYFQSMNLPPSSRKLKGHNSECFSHKALQATLHLPSKSLPHSRIRRKDHPTLCSGLNSVSVMAPPSPHFQYNMLPLDIQLLQLLIFLIFCFFFLACPPQPINTSISYKKGKRKEKETRKTFVFCVFIKEVSRSLFCGPPKLW